TPTAVVGSTVAVRAWLVGTSRHEPFLATEHNTLQCARPVDERTAWTVATWQLTQRGQPSVLFVSSSTHRSITAHEALKHTFDLSDMFIEGHVTHRVTGIRGRAPAALVRGAPHVSNGVDRVYDSLAVFGRQIHEADTHPRIPVFREHFHRIHPLHLPQEHERFAGSGRSKPHGQLRTDFERLTRRHEDTHLRSVGDVRVKKGVLGLTVDGPCHRYALCTAPVASRYLAVVGFVLDHTVGLNPIYQACHVSCRSPPNQQSTN